MCSSTMPAFHMWRRWRSFRPKSGTPSSPSTCRPPSRQIVLIENVLPGRRDRTYFTDMVVLPPPRIVIPRERYIVEVEDASQEDLYEAFTAPPP